MNGDNRRGKQRLARSLCAAIALGGLATSVAVADVMATAELGCDAEQLQAAAPAATTITSAEQLAKPVQHCRVEGYVTTTNPGPNKVYFALQLPEQKVWNKRFYFIGLGGSGGHVPTDSQYPSGNPLVKGFAVAGTDKGHQSSSSDWSWADDPVKVLDDAHRGAHVTTQAAQHLTRAYYNAETMHRYHSGCSGGGQMGMQAMQIHPDDYDGVLLGWPGGRPPEEHKRGVIDHAIFVREMTREPGSWISPDKLGFVHEQVLAACDKTDGAEDGVVWDSRRCDFDFKELQCKSEDSATCLTAPQVTSVENILRDTSAPITNIAGWTWYLGRVPPPWEFDPTADPRETIRKSSLAYVLVNGWAREILGQPDRDVVKDPLSKEEMWRILEVRAGRAGTVPYGKVGLDAFAKSGGKAIFYVGEGDIGSSSQANEQYFVELKQKMGADAVDDMARLYVVPAWGHCAGNKGPIDAVDHLLDELIAWVEKGKEPSAVETHSGADRLHFAFTSIDELRETFRAKGVAEIAGNPAGDGPPRDFLLCPFPQVSTFDKRKANVPGAVYDASNWSCSSPGKRKP